MALTSARVDIFSADSETLQDAFQFGVPGDTSWSFTGMTFVMDVKASRDDLSSLLVLTSPTSIVVDDPVQRVLHLNVPDTTILSSLPPAEYLYELVMVDSSVSPAKRTSLMHGRLVIRHGITVEIL